MAAVTLTLAALTSGCAWHRLEPARLERAAVQPRPETVGLRPVDEATSLSDLQAISRHWTRWGAYRTVVFPARDSDLVDLLVEVRLRQTADLHRGANALKGFAVGLTLYTLSPFIGPRVTERHEVRVTCRRDARSTVALEATLATDVVFGYGSDGEAVARNLDDWQVERIAGAILDALAAGCPPAT